MAEMMTSESGGKQKHKKVRGKKQSTRVDFTPMVDLGFLLITFFMLTTTMSKPKTMEINMPVKDKTADSTKIKESTAMTIILSENNRIYYYFGITDPQIEITNFKPDGIRKILLERNDPQLVKINFLKKRFSNKEITEEEFRKEIVAIKSDKDALMVLIKADDKAKYRNLVDILDEMNISSIGKYAIVDIAPAEIELIESLKGGSPS